ncbi:hypothetical protein H2200_004415 [Cladophialophora chaetospira]|uniref:Uncharacterized protein n=1 Tax=Cladophialophora chaetospira TaxID=386627 RepID=A0AA38XD56_9EURO|nr:hypothetical protein H2200_004415 [Cladophialophora chaetospira]
MSIAAPALSRSNQNVAAFRIPVRVVSRRVSTSTVRLATAKRRPPGRASSTSWFEERSPGNFTDRSLNPDVLRIRSPSTAPATPPDLELLRPPPLPFVVPPDAAIGRQAPLLKRVRHWWEKIVAEKVFYERALDRYREHLHEYRKLYRLLPWGHRQQVDLAAIYGGSPVLAYVVFDDMYFGEPRHVTFPKITRREFQLLLRLRGVYIWWLAGPWALLVASRIPLVRDLIPSIICPPHERHRRLVALQRRFQWWRDSRSNEMEILAANSGVTHSERSEAVSLLWRSHFMHWHYVISDTPYLSRYVPLSWWKGLPGRSLPPFLRNKYSRSIADTVLIMREGGFSKLSAEDIYDYCVYSASPTFLLHAKKCLDADISPSNAAMKKALVPVLDAAAKKMLAFDWTRCHAARIWAIEPIHRVYTNYADPDSAWIGM